MNCIIVDDEPLAREGIELNIEDIGFPKIVGQFSNALDANAFLQNNEVDLMFLDIQMPGITGLDFIRSLKNAPLVILTTAYPQYALEGFELDVVDYLMKPIRPNRFMQACNKAKDIYNLKKENARNKESSSDDFIYIKADRKYIRLFYKEIFYIEGMKDYVMLHTKGSKIMTAMNIKTILGQLPAGIFARVSKSHIINVNFIEAIEIDFILIQNKEIPLGRTYKDKFLTKYVKGKLIGRK